jgi:hypothetical protein
MTEYDYGPDLDQMKAEFLRDLDAQKTLAHVMDELEKARREFAHIKAQKKASRAEIRTADHNIARLENLIRMIFVNYALTEAPLQDGSVIIDEAAPGRGGFRPVRRRA